MNNPADDAFPSLATADGSRLKSERLRIWQRQSRSGEETQRRLQ
jgi:hypothetical protein